MKTAFTLETRWWNDGETYSGKKIPRWWVNFVKEYPDSKDWYKILKSYAKYRVKSNSKVRLVFNGPEELSFFILRYS